MAKKYTDYDVPDFLNDSSFLAWMRGEDEAAGFWEEWLREHPYKMKDIEAATEHYRLLTSFERIRSGKGEKREVWDRVNAAVQQADKMRIKRSGSFRKRWLRYAAVITLLLAAGWLGYSRLHRPVYDRIVKADGHIRKVVLPDSTIVVLNKYAQVSYSSGNAREVSLQGEAFFQVRKKWSPSGPQPFTVHTNAVKVTVLGTSFSVKSDEDAARVLLLTGKVRVSADKQSVIMKPGEKLEWSHHRFHEEHVNVQLYMAWKDGEFRFDHTSLKELAELVKDYYGYDLIIKDTASLPVKYISGRISDVNEQTLWNSLALLLNVKVEKHGHRVLLVPR